MEEKQYPQKKSDLEVSSEVWQGLINDGKEAVKEIQLQQFITRHIRDLDSEQEMRDIIRGIFYFDHDVVVRCDRCKKNHYELLLDDEMARLALKELFYEIQVSFSQWANAQSKSFQQGLQFAADSITLVPPIDRIIEERHKGADIG